MTLVHLFVGQGSQVPGMGAGLFDRYPRLTEEADHLLGYSIRELCVENSGGRLDRTEFTQPALYCVNILDYLDRVERSGRKPDFVAGHSLGELCALFAAGAFDFRTGLELVRERGRLMSECGGGGMLAVVGLDPAALADALSRASLTGLDIANLNSPDQVVLSGPEVELDAAERHLPDVGARACIRLRVSAPFHSRYMQPAREKFRAIVSAHRYQHLQIPVIANCTALPYPDDDVVTNLVTQIAAPVRWTESIQWLLHEHDLQFEQIGPGQALTGLLAKIRKHPLPGRRAAAVRAQRVPVRAAAVSAPSASSPDITPEMLGAPSFRRDHGVKYAYVAGSMVKAIASVPLVARMARAGLLSYFGTGGLKLDRLEAAMATLRRDLPPDAPYGMNLLHNLMTPDVEDRTVDLFLQHGVRRIEAAAYIHPTPALVRYRVKGLRSRPDGSVVATNLVMGKASRPEVATQFLSPPSASIVANLRDAGLITAAEAALAARVPLADDVCAEADSAGHTDKRVLPTILPAFMRLRNDLAEKHGFRDAPRIGGAGGLGTPEAIAAAFVLGADFVLTGSINQCTVEAGTSDLVKDLLAQANVQDTDMAPAGDMFEIGAKVQVLKKGLFFAVRANHLYDLYRQHASLDDIDARTLEKIEKSYFGRSIADVWTETRAYYAANAPAELQRAEENPRTKMAMVFRWYFVQTNRLAMRGDATRKVDFQIHCGPAMGAFNQFVARTPLEDWRRRHVDDIAELLMREAAGVLTRHYARMHAPPLRAANGLEPAPLAAVEQ